MKHLCILLLALLAFSSCEQEDVKPQGVDGQVWTIGTTDYRWNNCNCEFQTTGAWQPSYNGTCEQTYVSPCN